MEWHGTVKSDAERGPVGAWARHARLAAGYSSAEAAVAAATAAGIHLTVPYLRGIEAGSNRVGRALLARLGEFYGSEPPSLERPALSPEVVAEIRAVVAEAVGQAFDARIERIERLLADQAAGPTEARRPTRPRR